ncbi:MAG TPA: hypothetical protein VKA27_03795 [Sunxiuqinia sp.]|nr:hypothetical protein [Sunxiuqinia sp.]
MKTLVINSAEPDVMEFAENLQRIIRQRNITREVIKFDGVLISGSPQGDDIVEHHQPYF